MVYRAGGMMSNKRRIVTVDPTKIFIENSGVRSVILDKKSYVKKLQKIQDAIRRKTGNE